MDHILQDDHLNNRMHMKILLHSFHGEKKKREESNLVIQLENYLACCLDTAVEDREVEEGELLASFLPREEHFRPQSETQSNLENRYACMNYANVSLYESNHRKKNLVYLALSVDNNQVHIHREIGVPRGKCDYLAREHGFACLLRSIHKEG